MKHHVVAPSVGESITEVSILKWLKKDGQSVKSGDLLLEIESDKATVEIVAEFSGALQVIKTDGERIPVGETIAWIDDSIPGTTGITLPPPPPAALQVSTPLPGELPTMGPAARKMATEQGIDIHTIQGTGKGGRITQGDLLSSKPSTPITKTITQGTATLPFSPREGNRRVPMSHLRTRIAERLVQAQHTAAILTTFNEVDMGSIMAVRSKNKDTFKAKHGVALSFMSFFAKGCVEALKVIPEVNASIDGRDLVYHDYCDIGIAVGTERGLVVPIVRNAHQMGFVEMEKKMAELAVKARDGKLSISDMSGGTFTISNGGVYGSLLSTPILTPPQSGILGMHKIQERPVAIQGKVEIRPMMYLALSYDHRLIDGKGAVTFLVTLKDLLENPEKLGLEFEP